MTGNSSGPVVDKLMEETFKRAKELLSRIYAMFKPLVENLVRPLILQELTDLSSYWPGLTDEEKKEFLEISEHGLSDEAKKVLSEMKQSAFNLQPLTSEEVEETISEAVAEELTSLVNCWIETFLYGQQACDGSYYIQAQMISDVMLPPLNKKSLEAFRNKFVYTIYLDEAQALAILRQLRASLPAGKVLPDEMIELLALWRVKIV